MNCRSEKVKDDVTVKVLNSYKMIISGADHMKADKEKISKISGISEKVLQEIADHAAKNHVDKVVLFGSRSRGDFYKTSDIDLAVSGGNISSFSLAVDEETSTLLKYDIVNMDGPVQKELQDSIKREGIILYEKV